MHKNIIQLQKQITQMYNLFLYRCRNCTGFILVSVRVSDAWLQVPVPGYYYAIVISPHMEVIF